MDHATPFLLRGPRTIVCGDWNLPLLYLLTLTVLFSDWSDCRSYCFCCDVRVHDASYPSPSNEKTRMTSYLNPSPNQILILSSNPNQTLNQSLSHWNQIQMSLSDSVSYKDECHINLLSALSWLVVVTYRFALFLSGPCSLARCFSFASKMRFAVPLLQRSTIKH